MSQLELIFRLLAHLFSVKIVSKCTYAVICDNLRYKSKIKF